MNSPRTIPPRLRMSAVVSVIVVLLGSVVAVAGSARPASATTPQYLITPTGFDFGDIAMNNPSPAQQVRVTNISGATIMPSLTGGNAGVFGGTDHCSHIKLPNGASCTLSYQFTPNGIGARTTTISPSLNGQAFTLSFQGNGINPFLITPISLDFGNVPNFGHSATQSVTITNVGTVTESADTTGLDVGAFGPTSDTDCVGPLAPGASCHIVFQFNPTALGIGTQSAIATGVLDSQQYAIHLTGRSYVGAKPATPALAITPTALDFGDVKPGGVAPQQAVTFTNVSGTTITPGQLNLTGPYDDDLGCSDALAPGASCTENLQFLALATGRANGTATGTWGGQAFSISLTGNGISQFLITPTSFDFGNVPDGSQSAPQDVVITNVSNAAAFLSGSATAESDSFPETTSCQGVTIQPGESCRLGFEFAPSGPDPYSFTRVSDWDGQDFSSMFKGVGTAVKPAVTGISPTSGSTAGGNTVTVFGYGFTGVTEVLFGSTPGTNVTSDSDEQLNVTAPAHGAGPYNVHVVTSLGTSSAVNADLYTFESPPVVTAVSPRTGPKAGGTTVTVTGTSFTGATQVLFGNTPGTSLTVVSDTSVTVKSPAHSLGLNHVHVVTPAGRSPAVTADEYTFEPLPTVTAASPTSGPAAGGTTVTLTGTGFTGATQVLFGSTPGTSLSVTSDTHLTVKSPAHSTGPFNVHVVTPSGGESAAGSGDIYTYN